jgi:hypothetical protein
MSLQAIAIKGKILARCFIFKSLNRKWEMGNGE